MRRLLPTQSFSPRTPAAILTNATVQDMQQWLTPGRWSFDTETAGLEAHNPDHKLVGIGLANNEHCFYIDLLTITDEARDYLYMWLTTVELNCFNAAYDMAWLWREIGGWLNCTGDSYALFKNLSSEGYPGQSWSLEAAQLEVLGWPTTNKDALNAALKERGLSKSEMWQLPAGILGPYCASDADAAWQLWNHLEGICKTQFPNLLDYHQRLFLNEVELLIEQQLRGIYVDQALLASCRSQNEAAIKSSLEAFLNHPQVSAHVTSYNRSVLDAWKASEPARFNKDGVTVSKRWEAWQAREAKVLEDKGFNPNSKQQLAQLFYGTLGYKPLFKTATGRPAMSKKVLPSLGEPGKLLAKYNVYLKRRGYISAVIEKSKADGCIHPQYRSVGTLTTRLGGSGGLNLQQVPKNKEFLQCLRARDGHKLVQMDAEALEPVILAEFSRDPTMWTLYGPGAKQQDIYLFVAAKIPGLGDEILKYYDPDNPTAGGIAAAKKNCKRQRDIAKICTLSSNYGASARKIHETLTLSGIEISYAEVYKIHAAYWRLFAGIKRFEQQLLQMWRTNGGWIPSILGTPICVAEELLKDVSNRMVQTSGHMVLQLLLFYVNKLRKERGVVMHSWIPDFHDECTFESPIEHAAAAEQILIDALDLANQELEMEIKIKGPPMIADSLADIKVKD
jgi:DNA polymerase I-like protein with 3'-5' exonuclease and polymerase domains